MNFEEVVVYSMSICIVGDFYTIVVVVKVCMLIVNNCKSYVIEKFCIVCYNYKDNYYEHADLNGDGDVDGDGDDDEDNSTNHFSYSDGNDNHKSLKLHQFSQLLRDLVLMGSMRRKRAELAWVLSGQGGSSVPQSTA